MRKQHVRIGSTYTVKVSGSLAKVQLTREHSLGGWIGINLYTGREIRIRTAGRLRSEIPTPGEGRLEQIRNLRLRGSSYAVARQIIDREVRP